MEGYPVPGAVRIEVCGGIASGKTSFARLFRGSEVKPVFETFRANPFWRKFLASPMNYSFETEVSFTLHHSHQIKEASALPGTLICDFSVFLDLAYAKVAFRGSRLKAFDAVWGEVVKDLGFPTLLVYLRCDARTELDRIRARGRAEESSITLGYLRGLNDAVWREIARVEKKIRVITVDSARCNFVRDRETQRLLKERVLGMIAPSRGPRIASR
jgi:deoxyadenosine/deoxycytidine kinase